MCDPAWGQGSEPRDAVRSPVLHVRWGFRLIHYLFLTKQNSAPFTQCSFSFTYVYNPV